MNDSFFEGMDATADNFEDLSRKMRSINRTMQEYPSYNAGHEMYSLVRSAEINTLQLRSLASRSMGRPREELGRVLAHAHGIEISEEKSWLKISMPGILPGRNSRDNTRFAVRPLAAAVQQFQDSAAFPRFAQCTISIVHCYDVALGTKRIRDYDNIETKRFLDVLESEFLTNDSGVYCSVYQTTRIELRDHTEFYLMRPESLPEWLKDEAKKHTETC